MMFQYQNKKKKKSLLCLCHKKMKAPNNNQSSRTYYITGGADPTRKMALEEHLVLVASFNKPSNYPV